MANPLAPSVTTRGRKGLKFISIVEAAYNKASLSEEEAQLVNETPGLSVQVSEFIARSRRGMHVSKHDTSYFVYESYYEEPVAITDQVDVLRSIWPSLNPDPALRFMREVYPRLKFPGQERAEGPYALICPGFFSDQYGEEVAEVLRALAEGRINGWNDFEGTFDLKNLRQGGFPHALLRALAEQQPESDILICATNPGVLFPEIVRTHFDGPMHGALELVADGDCIMGAKEFGTVLLTNPNRLQRYRRICINCLGDKYLSTDPIARTRFMFADGVWTLCPLLGCYYEESFGSAHGSVISPQ